MSYLEFTLLTYIFALTSNVESDLICQSLDSHIVHMDLLYGCVMTDDVLLDLISELLESHISHMDNLFPYGGI